MFVQFLSTLERFPCCLFNLAISRYIGQLVKMKKFSLWLLVGLGWIWDRYLNPRVYTQFKSTKIHLGSQSSNGPPIISPTCQAFFQVGEGMDVFLRDFIGHETQTVQKVSCIIWDCPLVVFHESSRSLKWRYKSCSPSMCDAYFIILPSGPMLSIRVSGTL